MAVLGSLASGADDPPLLYMCKVRLGEHEVEMTRAVDLFSVIEGPVKAGNLLMVERKKSFSILKGKS